MRGTSKIVEMNHRKHCSMRFATGSLLANILAWSFIVANGKLPSIKDCRSINKSFKDCRNMGFQNVPYDYNEVAKIRLAGNPYVCDCSMIWFLREVPQELKKVVDISSLKCANFGHQGSDVISYQNKEHLICKTRPVRFKKQCKLKQYYWDCSQWPHRGIPWPWTERDVFAKSGKLSYEGLLVVIKGDFPCDCESLWLVRSFKRKSIASTGDYGELYCDKMRLTKEGKDTVSKWFLFRDVPEQLVCPQLEPDYCRKGPCEPGKTTCKSGRKSAICSDVNECKLFNDLCAYPEVCENLDKTGYRCLCPKGLAKDEKTKLCVPADPCKLNKNLCSSNFTCESTPLPSGKLGHRCHDINECLIQTHKCGDGEECRNKENGYECPCMPGLIREKGKCVAKADPCMRKPPLCDFRTQHCFSKDMESYECEDINECLTNQHDCDMNAKCINTSPGFKCKCKPGFKEYHSGAKCIDVNECSDKLRCDKHAKCTNIIGSYKCECNPGYLGDGTFCSEKNYCKGHGACSIHAECKNKDGKHRCVCKKGYGGNGKTCKDINECSKEHACPRHSKCHNTVGSYSCKCVRGFELEEDRCLDVNECKRKAHNCDKNARCVNVIGDYKCRCRKGFQHLKDGRLCLKEVKKSEDSSLLIILATIASLIIFVIGCICCPRRCKKQKATEESERLLL